MLVYIAGIISNHVVTTTYVGATANIDERLAALNVVDRRHVPMTMKQATSVGKWIIFVTLDTSSCAAGIPRSIAQEIGAKRRWIDRIKCMCKIAQQQHLHVTCNGSIDPFIRTIIVDVARGHTITDEQVETRLREWNESSHAATEPNQSPVSLYDPQAPVRASASTPTSSKRRVASAATKRATASRSSSRRSSDVHTRRARIVQRRYKKKFTPKLHVASVIRDAFHES